MSSFYDFYVELLRHDQGEEGRHLRITFLDTQGPQTLGIY